MFFWSLCCCCWCYCNSYSKDWKQFTTYNSMLRLAHRLKNQQQQPTDWILNDDRAQQITFNLCITNKISPFFRSFCNCCCCFSRANKKMTILENGKQKFQMISSLRFRKSTWFVAGYIKSEEKCKKKTNKIKLVDFTKFKSISYICCVIVFLPWPMDCKFSFITSFCGVCSGLLLA